MLFRSDSRVITEFPPITKRYFEKNKDPKVLIKFLLNDGRLSAYDSYYKQYSKLLKWDWRLLAALSFEESRFDPNAISHVGARGLMQLMPSTGKSFGLNDQTFTDPEENIKAGSKYINSLQRAFTDIEDPDERINFVLASFHAGLGHILDAKAIARKLGYDPNIWEGNVAECLLLKRDPEIYNDTSLVRCGSYKGETTLAHVSSIKQRYYEFTERVR